MKIWTIKKEIEINDASLNKREFGTEEIIGIIIGSKDGEIIDISHSNFNEIKEIISRLEKILITKTKSDFYHLFRIVYELFVSKLLECNLIEYDINNDNGFYWNSSSSYSYSNITDYIFKIENFNMWNFNFNCNCKKCKKDQIKNIPDCILKFHSEWTTFIDECRNLVNAGSHFSDGMFRTLTKEETVSTYSKIIFLLSMIIDDNKIYEINVYEKIRRISRNNSKFEPKFNIGEHGGSKIDATIIPVSILFNRSFKIKIPFYQREFVWKISDFEKFFSSDENFKGNITITSSKKNEIEIIDGQQRIITFLLVKFAIFDKLNVNEIFEKIEKHINWENEKMKFSLKKIILETDYVKNLSEIYVFNNQKHLGINNFFFTATVIDDFKSKVNIFRDLNVSNVPFKWYELEKINFINEINDELKSSEEIDELFREFQIDKYDSHINLEKVFWPIFIIYFKKNKNNLVQFLNIKNNKIFLTQLIFMLFCMPLEYLDIIKDYEKIPLSFKAISFKYFKFGLDENGEERVIDDTFEIELKKINSFSDEIENNLLLKLYVENYVENLADFIEKNSQWNKFENELKNEFIIKVDIFVNSFIKNNLDKSTGKESKNLLSKIDLDKLTGDFISDVLIPFSIEQGRKKNNISKNKIEKKKLDLNK